MDDLIYRKDALHVIAQAECGLDYMTSCISCECQYITPLEELPAVNAWNIHRMDENKMNSSIPWDYDGKWIIVTDGVNISVERFKKDAQDHFYPHGRWFGLEEVTAWMPLPVKFNRMEAEHDVQETMGI